MPSVFISSVIRDFEEYRASAKEAVELMDYKPLMSEYFGARPYSSKKACITEVEQSDIYLVILGEKYGFETDKGISVTHEEFRAAKQANKSILAFVQKANMEEKQERFREEVEQYSGGVFRAQFSTPEELYKAIIKSLRNLETTSHAISEGEFQKLVHNAHEELAEGGHTILDNTEPELILAFLPQPDKIIDIVSIEKELEDIFKTICGTNLIKLREGYKELKKKDFTGLETERYRIAIFANGLTLLITNPVKRGEGFFSGHFAPPDFIERIGIGFKQLISDNSGLAYIGLTNMDNCYVAPVPNESSLSMRFMGESEAAFTKLFIPLTTGGFNDWLQHCINRFIRIFNYEQS